MSGINTPATTDPRVQEIAGLTGETPDQVADEAVQYAQEDGITVNEELDNGVALLELQEALMGPGDEDDNDL